MNSRRLIRLFPPIWRSRYGAEFEALLESTPLSTRVLVDVLRRAASEWVWRTQIGRVIFNAVLASIATPLASAMAALVPVGSLGPFRNWPTEFYALLGVS